MKIYKGVGINCFMKLTKKEINEIIKIYDLGKYKSIKEFKHGWINYNFSLKTDKGNYVVRILGKKYRRNNRPLSEREFGVLDYLNKVDFPYKVPLPMRAKDNKILIKINGKRIWVYRRLPGVSKDPIYIIKKPVRETAKALAIYHKFIKDYPGKKIRKHDLMKGLTQNYKLMARVKPKDEADRLMLENLDMFNRALNKVKKIKFNTEMLMTHTDFSSANLLYDNKNNVVSIIDFENVGYAPKIRDIGHMFRSMCRKEHQRKEFVRVYEKYNKLTKREKGLLYWIAIRDNCFYFSLFYNKRVLKGGSEKEKIKKRIILMNWAIDSNKELLKEVEK